MGGDQSHEKEAEEPGEKTEKQQELDKTDNSASEDTPGELPQCKMGNRKVDSMSFMISCTNWY